MLLHSLLYSVKECLSESYLIWKGLSEKLNTCQNNAALKIQFRLNIYYPLSLDVLQHVLYLFEYYTAA